MLPESSSPYGSFSQFLTEGFIVTRASHKAVTSDACRGRKLPTKRQADSEVSNKRGDFQVAPCEIIYGLNNTIGQPQAGDCELAGKLDGFAGIHGWSVENAGRGLTMDHRYVS